ncbi:hypothetical protein EDB89DRAFT_1942638 [Lactarius sanguifluus]|nr:hypothetical protein EDB89DRAFT_1942638 [Lactarius sanguifluus]
MRVEERAFSGLFFLACVTTGLHDRNEATKQCDGRKWPTKWPLTIRYSLRQPISIPLHRTSSKGILSRSPDRAHSASHTAFDLPEQFSDHHHRIPLCVASAPLPRCNKSAVHLPANVATTLPHALSHAHQALLISPLTRTHPTVPVAPKNDYFSLDSCW